MGAHDDDHHWWLAPTKDLVRAAADAAVPTWGICLGHQLAAVALGGVSRRNPRGQQIGLLEVGWTREASADPLLDAYLNGLMKKVLAVAHPRPFQYTIRVVNEGSINAFTFGGGVLYIHAGLLARMENEAQFMMVLAHEIAHVTERRIPRGIEGSYGIQLLGQIAASAASASGRTASIPPELLQKTYEYSMNAAVSGHGRSHETEADVVGLEYLVKTGYDPREAPKTFQVLLEEYGDKGAVENFFYGSHPTNQARIAHLNELIGTQYADVAQRPNLVVNSDDYKQHSVQETVDHLVKLLQPTAEKLDCVEELNAASRLPDTTGAQQQLDIYARTESRVDVVREMLKGNGWRG